MSGTQVIDGYTVAIGDRVLAKNQSTGSQNGPYLVQSGAWVRTSDANTTGQIAGGTLFFVRNGTANGGTLWICTNSGAVVVDSTALTFSIVTVGPLVGLLAANNLSDLANAATARTNLGLGTLSTQSTVNLTSQATGTLQAAQEPAHTGDVTNTAGSLTLALANIPSATPVAGSLLATAIVAPSTPASGKASIYVDSTSKNLAVKNDAGTVNHGIQTRTATTNNWIRSIADDGSTTISQPAFTDVSGTAAATQGGTAQSTWTLGDLLYASALNTLSKLAGNTTTTKKFLTQTGTGSGSAAPGWNTIAMGDLGTGSPSSSNFLRGDGRWQPVLTATNGFSVGVGTPYSLTNSMAHVTHGTTNMDLVGLAAGTYLLMCNVSISNGATANDAYTIELFDTNAGAFIPGSVSMCWTVAANSSFGLSIAVVYTIAATANIQLFAINASGSRGSISSNGSTRSAYLGYVRLA